MIVIIVVLLGLIVLTLSACVIVAHDADKREEELLKEKMEEFWQKVEDDL